YGLARPPHAGRGRRPRNHGSGIHHRGPLRTRLAPDLCRRRSVFAPLLRARGGGSPRVERTLEADAGAGGILAGGAGVPQPALSPIEIGPAGGLSYRSGRASSLPPVRVPAPRGPPSAAPIPAGRLDVAPAPPARRRSRVRRTRQGQRRPAADHPAA